MKNTNGINNDNLISALKKDQLRLAFLFIMLFSALFLESCSCSCAGTKTNATKAVQTVQNSSKISLDYFKSAFEIYLEESKIVSSNEYKQKMIELSREQKETQRSFAKGSASVGSASSLLEDETGKFGSLKPLVKENRVDDIIVELGNIMNRNSQNDEVMAEGHKKLGLCYYIKGDTGKYMQHYEKHRELTNEVIKRIEKEDVDK